MLWVRSAYCKLFEMILTFRDPRGLRRKSPEKDKLCEEGSRLAWMDLAWTKGCIEMSEIIILLLAFLKIPVLMPSPSVWEQSSGRPSLQEREREKEKFGVPQSQSLLLTLLSSLICGGMFPNFVTAKHKMRKQESRRQVRQHHLCVKVRLRIHQNMQRSANQRV